MTNWRVVITVSRRFDNRANAISACDAIVDKVPNEWEIREESCKRE